VFTPRWAGARPANVGYTLVMARKDPISHLSRHPVDLPQRLADEILALGASAVAPLVARVTDPSATVPGSQAERVAIHAVDLLSQLDHPDVEPALLRAFSTWPAHGRAVVAARRALESRAGPSLVEPLLAVEDPARAPATTLLLAACGGDDPRIRDRIVALLAEPGFDACVAVARWVRRDRDDPELRAAVQGAFDRLVQQLGDDAFAVGAGDEGEVRDLAGVTSRAQLLLAVLERLGDVPVARGEALTLALVRANALLRLRVAELEDELAR
jgi:hypothetical protein